MATTATTAEVAAELRCGRAKVYALAKEHRIGINLGGRAGWRFTEADKKALREAMRPPAATPRQVRRPKRRRR